VFAIYIQTHHAMYPNLAYSMPTQGHHSGHHVFSSPDHASTSSCGDMSADIDSKNLESLLCSMDYFAIRISRNKSTSTMWFRVAMRECRVHKIL
jgi:hypothetical protein